MYSPTYYTYMHLIVRAVADYKSVARYSYLFSFIFLKYAYSQLII